MKNYNIPLTKGHKIRNTGRTRFKKGCVPWNKGKKGYLAGTKHPWMAKGKDHYNWKGGITPEHVKIRGSKKAVAWRKKVFERDLYTCVLCKARNGNGKKVILNADHIKSFAHHPELRFDTENGRTLCLDCHKKTDNYAGKTRSK